MKKLFTIAGLSLILAALFTGCKEPVFYNIIQDVPPEEATVNGIINSVTRYKHDGKEYLVTYSSSGLIYKDVDADSHGQWQTYSNLPFSLHKYEYYGKEHTGEQIIKVLADSKWLYILSVSYKNDSTLGITAPESFKLRVASPDFTNSSTDSWSQVSDTDEYFTFAKDTTKSVYYTKFAVFCTNDTNNVRRNAFIRGGDGKIYELNGNSITEVSTPSMLCGNSSNARSAVYFKGAVRFCDSTASVATDNAVYYAPYGSKTLYYSINGESAVANYALDAGTEIISLAATADSLLIGRGNLSTSTSSSSGGIAKTSLNADDGTPGTSLTEFTTNAVTQLSSSYLILTLLATDPTKNETAASLYASMCFRGSGASTSVSYDNVGLWSYYPGRGNWNRE